MKFEVGDLVVRKSGGLAMLVIDNIEITCQWIYKGQYLTQEFSQSDLISLNDWMIIALETQKED